MTKQQQTHKTKKQRKKKCKQCGEWFTPERDMQVVCSSLCAVKYAPGQVQKQKRKDKVEAKRNDKAYLKKKAQEWFNKYIRLRDKNQHCISCGHSDNRQYHAGHYRPTGRNESLRFNEDNCHKQCSICNNHLSGNLTAYREALIHKIGIERVEALEQNNEVKSYSVDELKEIIEKYKAKCKEIERK